ncbi:unnamed protein product [Penicillium roqueforti FM164]|uniref:Uncharacterized protein n=3 Tax=Penicillium TaxID=5073 RepID=A0A9W4NKE1_9EURO|nr:unnamed protein product [Penicillium salamii]CDM27592.1 unnamed protein product [Penicillium roqueforti FM164]CRL29622.1 unnamed protein product [Penicillium camemberti]
MRRKDINVNMRFCSNCEEDLRLCALLLALQILKDFLHGCPYRARAYLLALLHGPTWHSPTTHEGFDLEKHGHTYVVHPSIWPLLHSPLA